VSMYPSNYGSRVGLMHDSFDLEAPNDSDSCTLWYSDFPLSHSHQKLLKTPYDVLSLDIKWQENQA